MCEPVASVNLMFILSTAGVVMLVFVLHFVMLDFVLHFVMLDFVLHFTHRPVGQIHMSMAALWLRTCVPVLLRCWKWWAMGRAAWGQTV